MTPLRSLVAGLALAAAAGLGLAALALVVSLIPTWFDRVLLSGLAVPAACVAAVVIFGFRAPDDDDATRYGK